MGNKFTNAMVKLTKEELVNIVTVERNDYEPLAVEAAEQEIIIRGIDTTGFEKIIADVNNKFEQQKTIEANKVSNWKRFLHHIIDTLAIFVIIVIITNVQYFLRSSMPYEMSEFLVYVLLAVVYFGYFIFMEYTFQKTIGKFVTKTKVVNLDGGKPGLITIAIRNLCRLIPFDRFTFLILDNGLHDSLSKTKVVDDAQFKILQPQAT